MKPKKNPAEEYQIGPYKKFEVKNADGSMTEYSLEIAGVTMHEPGDQPAMPKKYVVSFVSYGNNGEPTQMGILKEAKIASLMDQSDPNTKKLFQKMLDKMKSLNAER